MACCECGKGPVWAHMLTIPMDSEYNAQNGFVKANTRKELVCWKCGESFRWGQVLTFSYVKGTQRTAAMLFWTLAG